MKVFSTEKNELGESPLWHPKRNSILWLDIFNRKLFEKCFDSQNQNADRAWHLPEFTSAMAHDKHNENLIWMVTDKSFGKFDLSKCSYQAILSLGLRDSYRANDGGVSPDGTFWFGTMEWSPSGINGSVYSITSRAVLRKQNIKIGIPNTFCWSSNGNVVHISDSFQKKIFSFDVKSNMLDPKSSRVFVDLSDGNSTPDGGAVDSGEFLWNAHWDGHKLVKYDFYGKAHEEIPMPVPKPTSCCFGGPRHRHLFVTSAWATMDKEEIEKYPMSGSLFVKEQATLGVPSPPFCLEI